MATNDHASINVRHHGVAIDEKNKRVKCNHCGKVVSSFYRLGFHLGGIRGDVAPCQIVPTNVKELIRTKLLEAKRENLVKEVGVLRHPDLPLKRRLCPLNYETNQLSSSPSGKHEELTDHLIEAIPHPSRILDSQTEQRSSPREAQKCIGRFFYETCLDFGAANSLSFQRMINATLGQGKVQYKIPSCQELKGWILKEVVNEIREYVRKIRDSWESTGCSILLDEWIDEKGRNLVNFLADCPQGPIYLQSADISPNAGDLGALQMILDGVIEEVGAKNVVQIVTCSTRSLMWPVRGQIVERHRTLFWAVSSSHCVELMLEKMAIVDPIKEILDKAKILTKFIHGHVTMLKLFRFYSHGHDLVKPSKIRSTMPFLTLENIISEKRNLKSMFASSEWNHSVLALRTKGKMVADLVGDSSFWIGAKTVLKATLPLVNVCLTNDNKLLAGYIYEAIDQAKEAMKNEFKHKKFEYMPFWKLIDEIWDTYLHIPLHAAGYYLNPCFFYAKDFYSDYEVENGLICCILRMVEDQHIRVLISQQLDEYRHAQGAFEVGRAFERRNNIPPALWWSRYGGQCPELQRFAIRILSQTCDGASRYGLKRSLSEKLLTNGRNPIEQQQLKDLTFVNYHLQLQEWYSHLGSNRDIVAEEIDPMDDWIVDDEPEETSQHEDLASTDNFVEAAIDII